MPCDPFQMAMIHRTFRNEFGHISGLIRAVAAGDTERARIVESYCGNMLRCSIITTPPRTSCYGRNCAHER